MMETAENMADSSESSLYNEEGSKQTDAELPSDIMATQQEVVTDLKGEDRVIPSYDDDDDELITLDPEHPLMKKFHLAVKNHLTRHLERLNLKLREKVREGQEEKAKHEDLCGKVYKVQQELSRLQTSLKTQHESSSKAFSDRSQVQEQLENIKSQYLSKTKLVNKQRLHVSELQSKMEDLAQYLVYMQKVTSDLRSDVTAMKKMKNKAQTEKRQAEEEKYQQDLYVERLTKQVEKLKEQIALFDVQMVSQTNDKQAVRDALFEAQMELDSMTVEKKQLLQQWNNSVLGMQKRDEAYCRLQDILSLDKQKLSTVDTELEGCRRAIKLEQEQNEELKVRLNRQEHQASTFRKLIIQLHEQQEALQKRSTTQKCLLQETEQSLKSVTTDCSMRQLEIIVLRKQIEKELCVRMDLEEKIMKETQEQLTQDNAAKQIGQLSARLMHLHRQKGARLSKVENELAAVNLEVSKVVLCVEAIVKMQHVLEQEMLTRKQLLSENEAVLAKHMTIVERKQVTINMWNKKVDQFRAVTGEDLGPLEIEVKALNKRLEELTAEMKEQRQLWLWQQGELVRLSLEKQAQSSAVLELNIKVTFLQQKNLRIKSEIEQEECYLVEMQRRSKTLMLDLQKLNSLVDQNTQLRQELEQSNILVENSFMNTLKDAERETVEAQLHLEKLQEEEERLQNSLVDAERQSMLWERKIQLARETRATVDSEFGKDTMDTMKAELQRMEGYYGQLFKQQERMVREMEAAIDRRENIVISSEAKMCSNRKHTTNPPLYNTLQGLRRHIHQTRKQADECNIMIAQLQQEQSSLSDGLRNTQMQISVLYNSTSAHNDELNTMQETREKNLTQLLTLQSRVKHLQAVKEGRYCATASGEDVLQLAISTHQERWQSIRDILQRVIQDFPQYKDLFYRINLALVSYT